MRITAKEQPENAAPFFLRSASSLLVLMLPSLRSSLIEPPLDPPSVHIPVLPHWGSLLGVSSCIIQA